MKKLIEQQIKKKYGTKGKFCENQNYKYKDFASKLRTVESRVNWLNDFLEPLGLEIKIEKNNPNSVQNDI